jgi:HlyD family secretion protein
MQRPIGTVQRPVGVGQQPANDAVVDSSLSATNGPASSRAMIPVGVPPYPYPRHPSSSGPFDPASNGRESGAPKSAQMRTQPHFSPVPQLLQAPAPDAPKQEARRSETADGTGRGIVSKLGKVAKIVGVVLVAGGSYAGYSVYERRQPYEWSGSVESRTVLVGSRSGGRVKAVLVREGQQVVAGEALVELESGELDARRLIALADVTAAEAALDKLSNGARPAEVAQAISKLGTARAAEAQAQGRADFTNREFARTDSLFGQRAISAAERDAALGQARAGVGAVREAIARAREEEAALKLLTSGTRPEELRVARAQVDIAKAKLALADAQTSELTIRSPGATRVEAIAVRPGDILRADARALSLLEAGELYVRIYVPEPRLGSIKVGQEVPISVDSFPKRTFKGRIEFISGVGEFTPRRLVTTEERADEVFAAKIALIEGTTELKAGMAAFIHVKK